MTMAGERARRVTMAGERARPQVWARCYCTARHEEIPLVGQGPVGEILVQNGFDPARGMTTGSPKAGGIGCSRVQRLVAGGRWEKGKIRKQVHYFLAKSKYTDLKLAKKPGLDDAKWFKLVDILELNFYDDILPIVTKAVTLVASR